MCADEQTCTRTWMNGAVAGRRVARTTATRYGKRETVITVRACGAWLAYRAVASPKKMIHMILTLVSVILIACGAAYWLIVRRREQPSRAQRAAKPAGRFGAVEIRPRSGACDAARSLVGRRFLAKDAPTLPLQGCAAAKCSCSFSKLTDRRTEGRRLEHGGLSASLFLQNSRRKKRDRRHGHRH